MASLYQVDLAVHRTVPREHLLGVLREARDFHVRHVSGSAERTVRRVRFSAPNLLLLGTALPDAPWQHTVQQVLGLHPSLPVVAVTHYEDEERVTELLVEGLSGYLSHHDAPERVLAVLEAAIQGEIRFSRRVMAKLTSTGRKTEIQPTLSQRNREVLRLLANGYDNKRIAAALHLAEGTVRNSVSVLYRQLGVTSRVEAARWAWRNGVAQEA